MKLLKQQQPPVEQLLVQIAQLVPATVPLPVEQPVASTAMEVAPPPEKVSSVQAMDKSGPGAEPAHKDGQAGPSDTSMPRLPLLTMMGTPRTVDQSMLPVFAIDDSDEQTDKEKKKKSMPTVFVNPTESVCSMDFEEEEGDLEVIAHLMTLESNTLKWQKKALDVWWNMVTDTDCLNEKIVRKGQYIIPGDNHTMVFEYLIHFEHTILTDSEVETGKLDKWSPLEDRKARIELAIEQQEGAE